MYEVDETILFEVRSTRSRFRQISFSHAVHGQHLREIGESELCSFAQSVEAPFSRVNRSEPHTLRYALSAGKAIISTPYLHAVELLDDERGALVPFDDPGAIAERTIALLDDDTGRHAMRKRAYLYARDMVWDRVAQKYMKSFEGIYNERLRSPRATFSAQNTAKTFDRLPDLNLDHLFRMTDHTGIVEHAVFVVPNYTEGYATDDNARALIVAIFLEVRAAGGSCEQAWSPSGERFDCHVICPVTLTDFETG